MDVLFTIVAYGGFAIVLIQTWPYFFKSKPNTFAQLDNKFPFVSIIVPARNEEAALPLLINSLLKLQYPAYEIIVVDDQSEDQTYSIASQYPVTLVRAPARPAGWVGKSWACHMGTKFAKGSLLLFTDADTIHLPDSLSTAVQALHTRNAVLLSAPSFHLNMHWWEKLMGPFHFLVTIAATPYNKPSLENPYAIGQYLLFDKDFYDKTGGHAAIKESLAEDVDLVKLTLICQGNYQIFTSKILYKVQMYRSFQDFISGWSRLLRLGMQYMSFSAIINSSLSILALTSIFAEGGLIRWIPTLGTLLCIWIMQHKMGNFSIWGILLFPVTITLFIFLGLRAALYRFFNTPMAWRGRVYKQPAGA